MGRPTYRMFVDLINLLDTDVGKMMISKDEARRIILSVRLLEDVPLESLSDEFSPQLIAAAPAMLDAIEDILADCDAQDDDPEDYRARYYDLHVGHVQRLREIVADIYPDERPSRG